MTRPALEAALRERPHDEQAWSVLGDRLAAEGDIRGELIALEQRASASERPFERAVLEHQAAELFEREHRRWLGPLADAGLDIQWTRGYATEVVIHRNHASTLTRLLELPISALLRKLTLVRVRKLSTVITRLRDTPIIALELRALVEPSLAPLAALVQLQELTIDGGSHEGLPELAKLPDLRELALRRTHGPLTAFANGFVALRRLDLSAHAGAHELGPQALAPLANLRELETLLLHDGGWFELQPLDSLEALQHLDLRSTDTTTLSPLASSTALRTLRLGGCTQVSQLDPLAKLTRLEHLDLAYTRVRQLTALSNLKALELLELTGTPVHDLTPLFGLPKLRRVGLGACEVANIKPLLDRKVALTGIRPPELTWKEIAERALRDLSKDE